MNLDITFEESPWESYIRGLEDGDTVSASYLLTLMEGETEESLEDAFRMLEDMTIQLDLNDLPRPSYSGENGLRLRTEVQFAENGMQPANLEETDPLRLYLEELAGIPVCGDVILLADKLAEGNRQNRNTDSIRNQLANLLLSRVVKLSGEYTGQGVLLLDLIQEGSVGLWKATEVFVGQGIHFVRICDWWIRFYMGKAVLLQARSSGVGQKLRTALEDYRAVDERLLGDLGRNPTQEEIAQELHMTVEETGLVKKMLDNARLLAQAKQPEETEEAEEEEDQAVENTALFQMRQRILDMLSGLDETEQKLLTLRFGLEGSMPLNPEDTGKRLGLTPEEVVAREAAALIKLREKQE